MTLKDDTRKVVANELRPDCFSFYDERDPSCRRCKVRGKCIEKLENTRPSCYGKLFDESHVECAACLVASQCTEKQEVVKMVRRKVKIRRRAATPAPEPEPEPEVVEDEVEENGEDYRTWKVAELREELDDRELDTAGRKAVLIARLLNDDGEDEDEPEPEPEPVKKVTRRRKKATPAPAPEPKPVKTARRRTRKTKAAPAPEPEEAAPVIASLDEAFALLLEDGQTIAVTRLAKDKYQFAPRGAAIVASPSQAGLRGAAFEKEAFSEVFYTFRYEDAGGGKAWKDMTPEERYAMAEDVEATWNDHENDKADQLRMALAVRKALGIEKWKPEYASRAARKALREGL